MSGKKERNQNEQRITVLPDPKFVKRPDFFSSENDQIGDLIGTFCQKTKNKTAGKLGARFNACYFGQLTEKYQKRK